MTVGELRERIKDVPDYHEVAVIAEDGVLSYEGDSCYADDVQILSNQGEIAIII
jgi:hypothetical protein